MNMLVESRIRRFLRERLYVEHMNCGAILFNVRNLCRVSGYPLELSFGEAGLASGPESRVAAMLVNRAHLRTGDATSEYVVRGKLDEWVRKTPPMGAY
jgi:hypothetical protein